MMKKINGFRIVLFLCCGLFIAGCNVYEDGPLISLRSKENRIEGSKFITRYSVDGNDALTEVTEFLDSLSELYAQEGLYFSKEKDGSDIVIKNNAGSDKLIGRWELSLAESSIYLVFYELPIPSRQLWQINRLADKEIWLDLDADSTLYRLDLTAK